MITVMTVVSNDDISQDNITLNGGEDGIYLDMGGVILVFIYSSALCVADDVISLVWCDWRRGSPTVSWGQDGDGDDGNKKKVINMMILDNQLWHDML